MRAKIVAISLLLALCACSKPEQADTKSPISEDRVESVSHAKLETEQPAPSAGKSRPSALHRHLREGVPDRKRGE